MSGFFDRLAALFNGGGNSGSGASAGAPKRINRAPPRINPTPIPRVLVKTLNISWESNNATRLAGGRVPSKVAPKAREWPRVKDAWANRAPTWRQRATGPAYQACLRALFRDEPHVVLLQEYELYKNPVTRSHSRDDITRWRTHPPNRRRYEVVAEAQTPYLGACLVVVRHDCIDYAAGGVTDISNRYNWSNIPNFPKAYPFTSPGRPVAVAEVHMRIGTETGKYLIVSSHSDHHQSVYWQDPVFVQTILDMLAAHTDAPFLIWGGDFNADVSGAGLMWRPNRRRQRPQAGPGLPVRKTRRSNAPPTIGEWPNRSKTVDWILATSSTGGNPVEHQVERVPSDHNVVTNRIAGRFADAAAR